MPLEPARPTRSDTALCPTDFITIFLTAVLANLALIAPYTPTADDWMFLIRVREHGVDGFFSSWIHDYGMWRALGVWINLHIFMHHPWEYGVLVVLAHAATACLLLLAARSLLGSRPIAWLIALIFACMPFGFGGMVWAPASNIVLITGIFFLLIHLSIRTPAKLGQQTAMLIAFSLLAFVSGWIQENLLFCTAAVGAAGIVVHEQLRFGRRLPLDILLAVRNRFSVFGPAIGSAAYIVAYRLIRGEAEFKTPQFRGVAVISTWARQYSNLYVFDPLRHKFSYSVLFELVTWPYFVVGSVLLVLLTIGVRRVLVARRALEQAPTPAAWVLTFVLGLMLAAGIVFIFSNGFSIDSRKRYPLVPLMLLAAGWLAVRRPLRVQIPAQIQLGVVMAIIVLGTLTSWLNIALWQYENIRLSDLVTTLSREHAEGAVKILPDPDLDRLMPLTVSQWSGSQYLQWILDLGMDFHQRPRITVAEDSAPTVARYSAQGHIWTIERGASSQ